MPGGSAVMIMMLMYSSNLRIYYYSNLTIFDFLLGVLRGVEDPSFRSSSRQRPIYKPD